MFFHSLILEIGAMLKKSLQKVRDHYQWLELKVAADQEI
jgi:hypothetical protein